MNLKHPLSIDKLYQMDCLDGMSLIQPHSVDLIFTDLPFGKTQNEWDNIIPIKPLFEGYRRVLKENGVIAVFAVEPLTSMLILENLNFFKYKIIWIKSKATNWLNVSKQPLRKYEEILIFYTGNPTYNPQFRKGQPYNKGIRKDLRTHCYGDFRPTVVESKDGKRHPTDAIFFKTAETEKGICYHNNQKPIKLCEYIIKTYSNKGDVVFDSCFGSGSAIIACINTKRHYLGFDSGYDPKTEKSWLEIAHHRIETKKIQQEKRFRKSLDWFFKM